MALEIETLSNVTVVSGGIAVSVGTSTGKKFSVSSIMIQADRNNTGPITVGGPTVTATTGLELTPGGNVTITGDNNHVSEEIFLTDIYINSASTGNFARVSILRRRT